MDTDNSTEDTNNDLNNEEDSLYDAIDESLENSEDNITYDSDGNWVDDLDDDVFDEDFSNSYTEDEDGIKWDSDGNWVDDLDDDVFDDTESAYKDSEGNEISYEDFVNQGGTSLEDIVKETKSATYNPNSWVSSGWNALNEKASNLWNGIKDLGNNINLFFGGVDQTGRTSSQIEREDERNASLKAVANQLNELESKLKSDKYTDEQKEKLQAVYDNIKELYGAEHLSVGKDGTQHWTFSEDKVPDTEKAVKYGEDSHQGIFDRISNMSSNVVSNLGDKVYGISQSLGGGNRYGITSSGRVADINADGNLSIGERVLNVLDNKLTSAASKYNDTNLGKVINKLSSKSDDKIDTMSKIWNGLKLVGNAFLNPIGTLKDTSTYAGSKLAGLADNYIEDLTYAGPSASHGSQKALEANLDDGSEYEYTSEDKSNNTDTDNNSLLDSNNSSTLSNTDLQSPQINTNYDDTINTHKAKNATTISNKKTVVSDEDLKRFIKNGVSDKNTLLAIVRLIRLENK